MVDSQSVVRATGGQRGLWLALAEGLQTRGAVRDQRGGSAPAEATAWRGVDDMH